MKNKYRHGTYNAICDVCGLKYKATDMRKRWDGAYVCNNDFEPRHPQELQRLTTTEKPPEWTRPDSVDSYTIVPLILPQC